MTEESTRTAEPESQQTPQRSLWRNRDFMALWSGETVSELGTSMSLFLFPIVGYALSGSTTEAALAGTAFALGSMLARLPAGVWTDRLNRRMVMVTASLSGALLYASLAVTMLLGILTLPHLLVIALLTGVVGAFFSPAETAAIRTVVPAAQLPTAFSQNEARQHMAHLVGPPLAGALYAMVRWVPFLFDAISFGISAIAVTRIKTPLPAPPQSDTSARSMRGELTEGLRFLWASTVLRAIVLFAVVVNFATMALFIVLTLKLLRAGVHPAAIGMIDTIGAVAGIAGAMAAPALIKRVATGRLAIAVAIAVAVAVAPMAFTNNVVFIGMMLALALLLLPAGNAAISSYLVAITPDRLQGRVDSALTFAATALQPAGPVIGGVLLGLFGGEVTMIALAGLICCSGLPLFWSRDLRRLGTPDRWQDGD